MIAALSLFASADEFEGENGSYYLPNKTCTTLLAQTYWISQKKTPIGIEKILSADALRRLDQLYYRLKYWTVDSISGGIVLGKPTIADWATLDLMFDDQDRQEILKLEFLVEHYEIFQEYLWQYRTATRKNQRLELAGTLLLKAEELSRFLKAFEQRLTTK